MRIQHLFFLSLFFFFQCTTNSQTTKMKAPEQKPPVLMHEKGLEDPSAKLLFEVYSQTNSMNTHSYKVFQNGDCYEMYKGAKVKLDSEYATWVKLGTLDEGDLKKIEEIIKNEVQDYIKNPNQKIQNRPLSINYWYFYLNEEDFIYSQKQKFKFQPKFARKLMKKIDF